MNFVDHQFPKIYQRHLSLFSKRIFVHNLLVKLQKNSRKFLPKSWFTLKIFNKLTTFSALFFIESVSGVLLFLQKNVHKQYSWIFKENNHILMKIQIQIEKFFPKTLKLKEKKLKDLILNVMK